MLLPRNPRNNTKKKENARIAKEKKKLGSV